MAARRWWSSVTCALLGCSLSLSILSCRRGATDDGTADTGTSDPSEDAAPTGSSTASAAAQSAPSPPAVEAPIPFPEPDFKRAKLVYARRCAFCHGEKGDGKGPAAEALWPRPRSFVDEPFRFVSTDNGVPTEADVLRMISNGMPGSSMPPWRKLLSLADRQEVLRYVMWLPKKRMFDKEVAKADERRARGKDAPSPTEILRKVETAFTPGRAFELPPKPAFSREVAARGSEVYTENCKTCHGQHGNGVGEQALKDSVGRPIRARSYSSGYYKGGYSDDQLATRILAGLPGSPMPAFAPALKDPSDVWPLVYRIRQFERRPQDAVGRGRQLFHQRGCASCHGIQGRGEIPNHNYITGTVRALNVVAKRMLIPDADASKLVLEALAKGGLAALADSRPYAQVHVTLAQYDALTNVIKKGNPAGRKNPKGGAPTFDMPAWKDELSDRQIDEILAYLISLQPWDEDSEG